MSTVKSADPCKIFAYNVYQPSKCEDVIEELRKCCIKHSSISLVCEGIDTSKPYEHNTVDYKETLK
ncbi:cx9C motif-containing protein 4 isoform X2 [Copidosoma floridanum]|uniref:cx9C motif-containing protein 4 isoform X2 n=1 Tax=Copidosoma floridanum TaxID=29053 RepID=UPI0006C99E4A|nr:cx9C motif-containing protein 4 isoform X2 [Copidosoma floridanum]